MNIKETLISAVVILFILFILLYVFNFSFFVNLIILFLGIGVLVVAFQELFQDHKDFYIQENTDNSSWFGFSLIIKPESKVSRKEVVEKLTQNNIDCRPIVTGDFTKNEVLKYFNYEVFGEMKNAKYLDQHGLFVGNHQIPLTEQIQFLHKILS